MANEAQLSVDNFKYQLNNPNSGLYISLSVLTVLASLVVSFLNKLTENVVLKMYAKIIFTNL